MADDSTPMVRIWSEVPEAPGAIDTDITLKPEDVPALISAQLRDSTHINITRDDGRIVHYERKGDWS